ncbi:predicted protein [Plenodomus lingam JN3]|uniref:Predicted protein n=1 Tax=Leptosphaeria maculans (strain JN3 / isolate v23.1.3 / race Av1-4-5-6-7-8) TaxID=985895 RepID=E5AEQ7_LEPMJ|nr:predicted protein [Plenodomus lingam JN3]CBY01696.1 predicted protein [Plenodomus lingam JN3]
MGFNYLVTIFWRSPITVLGYLNRCANKLNSRLSWLQVQQILCFQLEAGTAVQPLA